LNPYSISFLLFDANKNCAWKGNWISRFLIEKKSHYQWDQWKPVKGRKTSGRWLSLPFCSSVFSPISIILYVYYHLNWWRSTFSIRANREKSSVGFLRKTRTVIRFRRRRMLLYTHTYVHTCSRRYTPYVP